MTPRSSHERRLPIPVSVLVTVPIVVAAFVVFADHRAAQWIDDEIRGTAVFTAANWWTEIGRSNWTFIAAAVALVAGLLWKRTRLAGGALLLAATVGATGILTNLVKVFVGRARPKLLADEGPLAFTPFSVGYDWNSFPSGHATTALAIAATFWVIDPSRRWLWLSLGISVAATRVLLNAHYPGDILAGGVLGWSVALWMTRTSPRWWPQGLPRWAEPPLRSAHGV